MTEWSRDFDRDAFAAFADLGMSSYVATYTPPGGGTPIACTVLVDRAVQVMPGSLGDVYEGPRTEVVLQLREVAAPAQGGTLAFNAETWKLDQRASQDESASHWVLRK